LGGGVNLNTNKELLLPLSFEEIRSELGQNLSRMMDFFVPVEEIEKEISLIASAIKHSGKLVLIHGKPGVGKSTFIQSLKWRNHIPVKEVFNIDVTNSSIFKHTEPKLPKLLQVISEACEKNDIIPNKNGVFTFVIDYLESLSGEDPNLRKAFFQNLNGILRQKPILILWPITELEDINLIKDYSSAVSGTLFYRGKESIDFRGPSKEQYSRIVKNTITVLNTGYTYNDFLLTDGDFDEVRYKFEKKGSFYTLRDYIIEVLELWKKRSNQNERILSKIPKQTEIWFVFCMPEAEQLVTQFARKSKNTDDCWDAYFTKLDEYIHDNQKEAIWTPNRLQLAISGVFKTKAIYIPTNALVSCIAAYGKNSKSYSKIDWKNSGISSNWYNISTATKFMHNSPLVKQLLSKPVQFGNARGGSVKESLEKAKKAYEGINAISSNFIPTRDGSDKPFNKIIASALTDLLPQYKVSTETPHPLLTNIIPDIMIEKSDRNVCLEFHYTKKTVPSAIADYILKKLDIYMRQIESLFPDILS